MPGDWTCPACGDHQFARNAHCRRCGGQNPRLGGHNLAPAPKKPKLEALEGDGASASARALAAASAVFAAAAAGSGGLGTTSAGGSSSSSRPKSTKMCVAWREGWCMNGEFCPMGHGGEKPPKAHLINATMGGDPGDWVCPGCGDFQFRRNLACRFCGTANPAAVPPDPSAPGYKRKMCAHWERGTCTKGALCSFAHGEEDLIDKGRGLDKAAAPAGPVDLSVEPEDVQQLFLGVTIENSALGLFQELTLAQKRFVVGRGPLVTARDPTAVLLSRISAAKRSTAGRGVKNFGEWDCPSGEVPIFRQISAWHQMQQQQQLQQQRLLAQAHGLA
eukprot:TRINITY_DN25092_c0_g1_i1.p1 TRINITY_DN25092_c0_g1~~TRINITY_DN25092_c0_g1_i1.p1  ORF type:complete len:332 (+),score=57.31 TRINITY_DN25092_c0_g1_i1:159-1154(+)